MNGYIGVSGVARRIKSVYIGINNLARKVNSGYIGINGIARQWYENVPDPPTEYEDKQIGTWSSTSDVDTFCNTYNYKNGYSGLKLGNYVYIDHAIPGSALTGVQWMIAGFNLEHNQTAADGTVYDNGYGIIMIPRYAIAAISTAWGYYDTDYYMSSRIAAFESSTAGYIQKIVGSHMINRNVLLGSAMSTSTGTSAYTWTTSYLTSMSAGQLTGTFRSHSNIYDDGEANYKLPVFDYMSIKSSVGSYWLRGSNSSNYSQAWYVSTDGQMESKRKTSATYTRPLMLIR